MTQDICYMICEAETDLPLVVLDTVTEVAHWLECTRKAVYQCILGEYYIKGCYVEKIFLKV